MNKTQVIIWPHHGPVAGNERVSSRKIPDARLHTTETETEMLKMWGISSLYLQWIAKLHHLNRFFK